MDRTPHTETRAHAHTRARVHVVAELCGERREEGSRRTSFRKDIKRVTGEYSQQVYANELRKMDRTPGKT